MSTIKEYKKSKDLMESLCNNFDSRFIYFELAEKHNPKTWIIDVFAENNDVQLGQVRYYAQWRRYGFFPADGTVFERVCMRDIMSFLILIDTQQKNGIKPSDPQLKLTELDKID